MPGERSGNIFKRKALSRTISARPNVNQISANTPRLRKDRKLAMDFQRKGNSKCLNKINPFDTHYIYSTLVIFLAQTISL